MAGRFERRVVVITGSTGIAAATSKLAAAEGALVYAIGKDAESLHALQADIAHSGGNCQTIAADVTDTAQVDRAVLQCVQSAGRIDALFNVVGISGRRFGDGPVHECSDEGWDVTIGTNLGSMMRMSRAVLRRMLVQEAGPDGMRGCVLNMASVLAYSPEPKHFSTHAYAASKAGVIGLTEAMAAYYAPHMIRVNAIAPALVRTPMSRRAQQDAALQEFLRSKQPLSGGFLEAEDVANAAMFLMSDESRKVTGTVFPVDAGWAVS
jgi:NAD(P)-dependent dehydrogenase (short-subunit alcohol dehydrogenase family)